MFTTGIFVVFLFEASLEGGVGPPWVRLVFPGGRLFEVSLSASQKWCPVFLGHTTCRVAQFKSRFSYFRQLNKQSDLYINQIYSDFELNSRYTVDGHGNRSPNLPNFCYGFVVCGWLTSTAVDGSDIHSAPPFGNPTVPHSIPQHKYPILPQN